jgi:hypothetical protein
MKRETRKVKRMEKHKRNRGKRLKLQPQLQWVRESNTSITKLGIRNIVNEIIRENIPNLEKEIAIQV